MKFTSLNELIGNQRYKKISNNFSYVILLILCTIFMPTYSYCGKLIINYGFEDWSGSEDTTPGYIFSTSDPDYWTNHKNCCQVVSSCSGRTPHSGTYYHMCNYYTGEEDMCLGTTPNTQEHRKNVGLGGTYPQGYGNKVQFSTAITSRTFLIRFWFRLVNYKAQNLPAEIKFLRLYGMNSTQDWASAFIHFLVRKTTNTLYYIIDPGPPATWWSWYAGIDLMDGNWHSCNFKVIRNSDNGETGNLTVSVWWDDWSMTTIPSEISGKTSKAATRTITATDFGNAFKYIQLGSNLSAQAPQSAMIMDVDDVEIWDGDPTVDLNVPAPPAGLRIIK